MSTTIYLPEIEENVKQGVISSILISEGDSIEADDPIIELETDKAAVEVPAGTAGTVTEILVAEGDEISVGDAVCTVEAGEGGKSGRKDSSGSDENDDAEPSASGGEDGDADTNESDEERGADGESSGSGKADSDSETSGKEEDRDIDTEKTETGDSGRKGRDSESGGKLVPAAPSVRRLARELGIDIGAVEGSGPGGRISKEDVKSHTQSRMKGSAGGERETLDFSRFGEVREAEMSRVRQITAESTISGWRTMPHVTQFDKADIGNLEAFRQRYKKRAEAAGVKLTITSLLVKTAASALVRFPRFNAALDLEGGRILFKEYINIGVAVDTDRGLLVPVIRDAETKSIMEIAQELGDLADRARKKKIKREEMEGGSFIISNLGGIGGTAFTPLIYPDQAAILGVSGAATEPVWDGEEFVPRTILPLSLSYDHRLIDGADGARFLRWFCEALEQPLLTVFDRPDKQSEKEEK